MKSFTQNGLEFNFNFLPSLFLKGIVFLLGFTFAGTQSNVNDNSTFLVFERLFQWTNYS
jgi:hypothetical protein